MKFRSLGENLTVGFKDWSADFSGHLYSTDDKEKIDALCSYPLCGQLFFPIDKEIKVPKKAIEDVVTKNLKEIDVANKKTLMKWAKERQIDVTDEMTREEIQKLLREVVGG